METKLQGIDSSPIHQVLIEESIDGWKEFEYEVMRDKNDNKGFYRMDRHLLILQDRIF